MTAKKRTPKVEAGVSKMETTGDAGVAQTPPLATRARAKPVPPLTPRKFTPEVLGRICERLSMGRPFETSVRAEGLHPESLRELMERDPSVADLIAKARAEGQLVVFDTLGDCIDAGKSTAGVQFWLERLWPKDFGPPAQRVEKTGADGGPVKQEVVINITRERAIEIARSRKKLHE